MQTGFKDPPHQGQTLCLLGYGEVGQHQEARGNLISTILPTSLSVVCLWKFDVYFQDDGKNEICRHHKRDIFQCGGRPSYAI